MIGILTKGLGGGSNALLLGPYRLHFSEPIPVTPAGSGGMSYVGPPIGRLKTSDDEDTIHPNRLKKQYTFTIECQNWIHDVQFIATNGSKIPVVNITKPIHQLTLSTD